VIVGGWSTENLILDYLEWLCEQLPNRPICLILDHNHTHDTEAFQAKAEQLGGAILWIPKGQAGFVNFLTDAFSVHSNRKVGQNGRDIVLSTTVPATHKRQPPC
jgi:predicted transcriptional regulator